MNGCLNSLIFQREYNHSGNHDVIDYPIIVVNGFEDIYRRDVADPRGYRPIHDNFQIEVNYSYINKTGSPSTKYFLLDVVSEDKMQDFLSLLEVIDVAICQDYIAEQRRNASRG